MADDTVLVTGGTGFIGAYTSRALADAGYDVVAYDVAPNEGRLSKLGIADEIGVRRGDLADPTDVFRAVRETGATRVAHLAALLSDRSREAPRAMVDVNVVGTNTVFEAARTFDLERVVWASSGGVYGPASVYGDDPVDEDAPMAPTGLYGATKAFDERQAALYRDAFDAPLVGLRPQMAYGPYRTDGATARLMDLIEKPAVGEPVTIEDPGPAIGWHHVEDIARGFRLAFDAPADRLSRDAYNLRGDVATIPEVADVVRDLVPDAEIEVVPADGDGTEAPALDASAARSDLGYEREYDVRTGVWHHANAVRRDRGLDPLDG